MDSEGLSQETTWSREIQKQQGRPREVRVRSTEPDPQRQRPGGTAKLRGSQGAVQPWTSAAEDPDKSTVAFYGTGFQTHSRTSLSSVKELCLCRCGIRDERGPCELRESGKGVKRRWHLVWGLGDE